MNFNFKSYSILIVITLFCVFPVADRVAAQKMDGIERGRMKEGVKNAVKKDYYDENFHGVDFDTRFKKAEDSLNEATTTGQSLGIIAQTLMDFNDSHLYFLPPATNLRVEYGWRMKMLGDKCFVTSVKPKSDADKQGLKPGDQLLKIEGFIPTRKEFWKMRYYYNVLSRRQGLRVTALAPGAAEPKVLNIASDLRKLPISINAQNFFTISNDLDDSLNEKHLFRKLGGIAIWRMPSFSFDPADVDSIMSDRIGNSNSLILDLRGNGGGYVKTLERLAGYFFDKDIKIADLKGRKKMDPMEAKAKGKGGFGGKIIVLIDSESGSASEIFARLIQLEKRGVVIGDTSAGAVMQAKGFDGEVSSGYSSVFYGASITNADVIMSDGKSVEHVGVIPDETIIPTGDDLAKGKDPVLSRAAALLGAELPAEVAGQFFPYDWDGK